MSLPALLSPDSVDSSALLHHNMYTTEGLSIKRLSLLHKSQQGFAETTLELMFNLRAQYRSLSQAHSSRLRYSAAGNSWVWVTTLGKETQLEEGSWVRLSTQLRDSAEEGS